MACDSFSAGDPRIIAAAAAVPCIFCHEVGWALGERKVRGNTLGPRNRTAQPPLAAFKIAAMRNRVYQTAVKPWARAP